MTSPSLSRVIQCSGCQSKLKVGAKAFGKTLPCPKCGQPIAVPADVQASVQPEHVVPQVVDEALDNHAFFAPNPQVSHWPADPLAQDFNTNADWNAVAQPVAAGSAYRPPTITREVPREKKTWLWVALGGAAAFMFMGVLLVGVFLLTMRSNASVEDASQTAGAEPVETAKSNEKNFPRLGSPMPFGEKMGWHRITIPREQGDLKLNIFVPNGDHAPQSLPIVFEAPPGTNLLHGADIEFPRLDTEYLPFTEAGMITVTYAIDGYMPEDMDPTSRFYLLRLSKAYKEFVASDAGVDCGKLAIDYVLAQVPQADPKRMYSWGHSSAGTLALLLASKDARLSKCIAMAPASDLEKRMGEIQNDRAARKALPNLSDYLKNGSPITHVEKLKCPVFIGHAKDDDNVRIEDSRNYAEALRKAGGNVTLEELDRGGHYQALLREAVPRAIAWINKSP